MWSRNSYIPATSAVELRDFIEQGVDVRHELILPVDKSYQSGDEPMRKVRAAYSSGEHPLGDREATGSVIAVTSSVEQVFVILDKLAREFDNSPEMSAATAGRRAAVQAA